jgi:hypothetical protein
MAYGVETTETVPVCPECKCRLLKVETPLGIVYYEHFYLTGDFDARGCKCSLLDKTWES